MAYFLALAWLGFIVFVVTPQGDPDLEWKIGFVSIMGLSPLFIIAAAHYVFGARR
ncbi:MAG: hypothetical protein AAGF20_10850 [Pseudomonadota bacterium]